MHYDTIVIGMGLSGLMAAKTAVEAGQKVLIVGKGTGSLCLFSSTVDVAGNPEMKNPPDHPYSKVGRAGIHQALSSFTSFFPAPYSFHSVGDGNCRVLTGAGTLRPTRFVPSTMIAGISIERGTTLIVGFEGFKDFYANYAAHGNGLRGITVPVDERLNKEVTATALSRLMEMNSFRERIAGEIRKRLEGERKIGFPAVFGWQDPVGVKKGMEDLLGIEVFEIPTLPPSIPGKRIFNRFRTWLIQNGATFLMGYPVSQALSEGKRCEGIYVNHPSVTTFYSADHFVLATGRFMGGGLVADQERISEPLVRLPVFQPPSREEWFGRFFSDHHPIHEAGILTDSSLRPVDERGDLLLENVWIAGSILAHHNLIEEKSREGIEIATGFTAARNSLPQRSQSHTEN